MSADYTGPPVRRYSPVESETTYSSTEAKAPRELVSVMMLELLAAADELAASVQKEAADKLASIMTMPRLEDEMVAVTPEEWPRLFADVRQRVDSISSSLRDIRAMLQAVEL